MFTECAQKLLQKLFKIKNTVEQYEEYLKRYTDAYNQ
jgi:hypothetical protein